MAVGAADRPGDTPLDAFLGAMVGGGLMAAGLHPTLHALDREPAHRIMFDTAQRALAPYLAGSLDEPDEEAGTVE